MNIEKQGLKLINLSILDVKYKRDRTQEIEIKIQMDKCALEFRCWLLILLNT